MIRRAVFVALAAIGLLAATACTPARPYYKLDEAPGATVVDDANNVQNGTPQNVTFGWPGRVGKSAHFNGTNSVIRFPDNNAMDAGNGDFSVSASVKFSQLPGASTWDVVRKGVDGTAYWKMEVFVGDGTARAECFWRDANGRQFSVVRGRGLHDNAWHTITCSIVGNEHRITVDGSTTAKTPPTPLGDISNGTGATIGAKPGGGDHFNGFIDEVRFA